MAKQLNVNNEDGYAIVGSGTARELTAREVNRIESARLKAEKKALRAAQKDVGRGEELMRGLVNRFPGDAHRQISIFFEKFVIYAATGRKRAISESRKSGLSKTIQMAFRDLKKIRINLQNATDLKAKHVQALARYWSVEVGIQTNTLQGKLCDLRRYAGWIGRAEMVPEGEALKDWLAEGGVQVMTFSETVATRDKSWEAAGVDARAMVRKMGELDELAACNLELIIAFGLRMRESLSFDPMSAHHADAIRVIYGTKGGLSRFVPFSEDPGFRAYQEEVLARAKVFAKTHPKGRVAPVGYTLERASYRFYYLCRKLGITKKSLGVTLHGLRHQYAQALYEEQSGASAPIKDGATADIDQEAYDRAREFTSKALGHHRKEVVGAYIGSTAALSKQSRVLIKGWIRVTEGSQRFQAAMVRAGIQNAWLIGPAAQGMQMSPSAMLTFCVREYQGHPFSNNDLRQLQDELVAVLGRPVFVMHFTQPGEPMECLSLHIAEGVKQGTARKTRMSPGAMREAGQTQDLKGQSGLSF